MLYMMLIKNSRQAEKNPPQMHLRQLMDDYNDALELAGVKIMAKGLYPDREAYKVQFFNSHDKPLLTKGPFLDDHNQVAGFFLIEVTSKEEALNWLLRAPDPQGFGEGEIELRQVR